LEKSTNFAPDASPPRSQGRGGRRSEPKSVIEEVLGSRMAQNVARQATRTVAQQVMRGIFGMLKGK